MTSIGTRAYFELGIRSILILSKTLFHAFDLSIRREKWTKQRMQKAEKYTKTSTLLYRYLFRNVQKRTLFIFNYEWWNLCAAISFWTDTNRQRNEQMKREKEKNRTGRKQTTQWRVHCLRSVNLSFFASLFSLFLFFVYFALPSFDGSKTIDQITKKKWKEILLLLLYRQPFLYRVVFMNWRNLWTAEEKRRKKRMKGSVKHLHSSSGEKKWRTTNDWNWNEKQQWRRTRVEVRSNWKLSERRDNSKRQQQKPEWKRDLHAFRFDFCMRWHFFPSFSHTT